MFKTLRNAWSIPDLRKKLFVTLALLMVFRAGIFIPVPDINRAALQQMVEGGLFFGFLDILSGGGFKNFSIFAMGISPYITASIIMSLLTIALPRLEQLQKEGQDGRKKIAEITRYLTVGFALLQSFSMAVYLSVNKVLANGSALNLITVMITLTTGTLFVMWLGEKITEYGIGNGSSLIIFTGIIAKIPSLGYELGVLVKGGTMNIMQVALIIIFAILVIIGIVIMDLGERRVPVQYAQRKVGAKTFGGQNTHIPINVNSTGVIAIIFAMSVMQFPLVISQLFLAPSSQWRQLFEKGLLSINGPIYPIVYVLFIIFFTWFYTSVTFKPDEMAENLQKSGGFIPGIRPGHPTENFLTNVLNRMTFIGGIFASIVAIIPILLAQFAPHLKNFQLGGTTMLIMVNVALELRKQVRAQLVMKNYGGFLK
ncbi:preprotein translocase subunit SecY [Clostridium cylindrosporum]|uniref:Protein translocase subunit SecY n=1 Tax=Clostridium cylindrosporum DSM 605 TaxID=1121307 RepID=A0A0J8D4Y0_CLOCY|nr:preprotein translocase subunit SecY [Clostridium cylindrosporum]KMT21220.1 protein translocase subunit SecY [Clostridium cylindrosporum DSM 605]